MTSLQDLHHNNLRNLKINNNNLRWADLKISIAAKLDRDEAKCARYHQVAVQ